MFVNFDPEKGVPHLQQHFNQDFRSFSRENPSFGMLTILKIGKYFISHKTWKENSKCLL